ncbi:MAG: hypothetical protein HIU82_14675 [Proteobacteria bacterium]|nr:hypothetical protein [Pseudomonadota bacterium]
MGPQNLTVALRFIPLIPLPALAVLAALAALAVGFGLWRRARGAAWRGAAFAALLGWLAGPALLRETVRPLPDIGVLLVDHSASMRIGDRAPLAARAAAALTAQAAAHPGLELRTVVVSEHGDRGTRLFAALGRALADIPADRYAGTIAITDGEVADVPAAAARAAALGGAPFNLLIPARGEQTDRVLRVLDAPAYGIVGKSVALRVAIEDLGAHDDGTPAALTIRRGGGPAETRRVPVGRAVTIPVPIRRAGPVVIALAAAPLAGEVSTVNNQAVVQVTGVRDRLRVLLVSGSPHQGERTWRRLLTSDPAVDLIDFTILRPPDKVDLTPLDQLSLIPFPVDELFDRKIDHFDLIILDRFADTGLLPLHYLANVATYVRGGGALLLDVGPEFAGDGSLADTPLRSVLPAVPAAGGAGRQAANPGGGGLGGDLGGGGSGGTLRDTAAADSPAGDPGTAGGPAAGAGPSGGDAGGAVVDGRFRPRVTAIGARDPVTAGLAGANPPDRPDAAPTWGPWYRRIRPADVHGEVLMRAPGGAPLLVLNRVGKGRVALLLSDQIWLWSRGHDGGGPDAELLRRVAHWLMKEPALEENALTASVTQGRLVVVRRRLAGHAAIPVTATGPDGVRHVLDLRRTGPGLAAGSLAAPRPGVWRVTDGTRTAVAAVTAADPAEYADLRATADKLGPLAAASGGGVHWLGSAAAPLVPTLRRVGHGEVAEGDGARRDSASGPGWVGLERRGAHVVTGVALVPLLPPWAALPLILGLLLLGWRREGR